MYLSEISIFFHSLILTRVVQNEMLYPYAVDANPMIFQLCFPRTEKKKI